MKLILASAANLELSRSVEARFAGLVVNTPAVCQWLGKILTGELLCFYLSTEKHSKSFWRGVLTQDLTFESTLLLGLLSMTSLWSIPV